MSFGTAGIRNSGGSGGFHILGYTESQLERSSFDRHKSKAHLRLLKRYREMERAAIFDAVLTRQLRLFKEPRCESPAKVYRAIRPCRRLGRCSAFDSGSSGSRMDGQRYAVAIVFWNTSVRLFREADPFDPSLSTYQISRVSALAKHTVYSVVIAKNGDLRAEKRKRKWSPSKPRSQVLRRPMTN